MQLALERLGARLIVSSKLIGDGVDALKGSESIRLTDARLLLGLAWGGVAAQIRLSSACVRAFLLISAIKMCSYDDQNITDIIYEYLSRAKLLDSVPVSVHQLRGLIDVLSGHCDALLSSVLNTMDEVIQSLANEGPENWPRFSFEPLSVKGIAEMLLCCFEAIQQDEGGYIEISGQDGQPGLIWIATVLLWLSPAEVSLVSQGRRLLGAAEGKVRIMVGKPSHAVTLESRSSWTIRTWKAGKSITTIISADDLPEWVPPRRTIVKIPKKNVRYYLLKEGYDAAQLDLVGATAAGLIDSALHHGVLKSDTGDERTTYVHYKLLCDESFVRKGGRVMEEYGWELDDITDHATCFLNCLSDMHKSIKKSSSDIARLIWSQTWRIHSDASKITSDVGMVETAMHLAVHALTSAQASFGTLVQFYYPNFRELKVDSIFYKPTTDGHLYLDDFVKQSYVVAGAVDFSRIPSYTRAPVIVSSEGRVLFPRAMLDHSTRQSGLLGLVVVPGRIIYDGCCFDSIADVLPHGILKPIPSEPSRKVPIFDETSRQLVLQVPYEQSWTNLQFHFAKDQRVLLMRTRLFSSQDDSTVDVTYPECLRNLARAGHLEASKFPLGMSDVCAELCLPKSHGANRNEISLAPALTRWGQFRVNKLKAAERIVTHVPNSQELRFFISHPTFHPLPHRLYVLQGVEVIEALNTIIPDSEQGHYNLRMITGKDR